MSGHFTEFNTVEQVILGAVESFGRPHVQGGTR